MITRRGSLLWSGSLGDALLMYKAGDVVKPVIVSDPIFTGVVRSVDTKTNKVTVAWGGGTERQHDPDEIMPVPFFKTASTRRMKADTDGLLDDVTEIDEETQENPPESTSQTDFVNGQRVEDFLRSATDRFASVDCGALAYDGLKSRRAAGQMSMMDIRPGGEYYEWAKQIERDARLIQRLTRNAVRFIEMRPFDVYQGPYARMSVGDLWATSVDGEYLLDLRGGYNKDNLEGMAEDIAEQYLELVQNGRTAAQKRVVIEIDGRSLKSIEKAEKQKSRLENQGYTLVKEQAGFTTSKLVYEKRGSCDGLKSRRATGEMSMMDIRPGGEYYEWAEMIKKAAREIQRLTKNGVRFIEMRPFDVYQGPYARMSTGKLWSAEGHNQFVYEVGMGRSSSLEGTPGEIALELLAGFGHSVMATEGLRSRRAMYWCAPDRTFRLTKQEQEQGVSMCPKCRIEMNTEKFTRSDKLLICPECGFKIPTSKAVTRIEIKVPEGTEVDVMTQGQEDKPGQAVMACGRSRKSYVDAMELTDLPRMSLSQIAMLVYKDWRNVNYAAKPYLSAMSSLQNVSDNYGMDSGKSIVAYFLSNASSWRGEVAKAVKKELQRRIRR